MTLKPCAYPWKSIIGYRSCDAKETTNNLPICPTTKDEPPTPGRFMAGPPGRKKTKGTTTNRMIPFTNRCPRAFPPGLVAYLIAPLHPGAIRDKTPSAEVRRRRLLFPRFPPITSTQTVIATG